MKEHERHPAVHSGSGIPAKRSGGGSQVVRGKPATSSMKVALPAHHPAAGCSPKHAGEVKAVTKQ